jgi:hypothetical protein
LGTVDIRNLFHEHRPVIDFYPQRDNCCGIPLHVQKTRTKTKVATLAIGDFIARETVLCCPNCGSIYTSEELTKLIPTRCDFGYDVLVYVGKSIFIECRNDKEIIRDLFTRNVTISSSGIAYLAKKFIVYLAIAHRASSAKLKENMTRRGGYILHLDGTCEGDSPHLMSGLDGISEIVLDNIKLPSENGEQIIPFLVRIKKSFGNPLALVRDMGKGISKAIERVFGETVFDFICHFHFLRDIGKDLFDKENDVIRKRLKHHGIQGLLRKKALHLKKIIDTHTDLAGSLCKSLDEGKIEKEAFEQMPLAAAYTLIQWTLDGKNQGKGYGFPFDRPYLVFYQRLKTLHAHCEILREINLRNQWRDNKPVFKTYNLLRQTINDTTLRRTALQMQEKVAVFDKLRDAMRIAKPEQNKGLNDEGDDVDIKAIEKGVEEFRNWLINEDCYVNKDYHKMIKQIDNYWKKLFADPITVKTSQGEVIIQPQRTNNLLERFFRDIKRGYRKKNGINSMTKTLKAMLQDTPLVKNLENRNYLSVILDGKLNLEQRFSEIDAKIVREELKKSQKDSEKIPPKIKKIIKNPNLPEILTNLFIGQYKLANPTV